jgi:hypothetical protein
MYASSTTATSNPNVERHQPRYTDPQSINDPLFPDVGASDLNPMGRGGGLRMPG